jgi:hypothetical protein
MYTKQQVENITKRFKEEENLTHKEFMLALCSFYDANKITIEDCAFIVREVYGASAHELFKENLGITNDMIKQISSMI